MAYQHRPQRPRSRRGWNWLIAIPIVLPLLTPVYNRVEPQLWGIPFFYWYQLGCGLVTIVVLTVVFQMTKDSEE